MPQLPQPDTVSPGRLHLIYYTLAGIRHECGINFREGVDMSIIADDLVIADDFAQAVKPMLLTTTHITGWKITDLLGVSLYEDTWLAPIAGLVTADNGKFPSESSTLTATGKGVPAFGLKAGLAKCVIFPGWMQPTEIPGPRVNASTAYYGADLVTFLNDATDVGCDHYGVKATWKSYMDAQVNAHFQKRYGL